MLQAILFWRGDTMELARLRKEKESINETNKILDGRGVTNDEHLGNI